MICVEGLGNYHFLNVTRQADYEQFVLARNISSEFQQTIEQVEPIVQSSSSDDGIQVSPVIKKKRNKKKKKKKVGPVESAPLPIQKPPQEQLSRRQAKDALYFKKRNEWDRLCRLQEKLVANCRDLPRGWYPADIYQSVRAMKIANLSGNCPSFFKLTKDNYTKPLQTLLFADEIHEAIEMRKYDKFQTRISLIRDPKNMYSYLLETQLNGISKGQPSLIPSDLVVLENSGRYEVCPIVDIEHDWIRFRRPKRNKRVFLEQMDSYKFNVSFVASGIPYSRYHRAVQRVASSHFLRELLFESTEQLDKLVVPVVYYSNDLINVSRTATKVLDQRLLFCNDRQRQAVKGILRAWCRPKPYILFGPPGTGKTFTVVEAIVQIFNRARGLSILVCANSNNCADQLAQLIDETKLVNSMKRYMSLARYLKKPILSHYDTDTEVGLRNSRVVVTTNCMAAKLVGFMQFDYVFIDEAGHAHEPESLIPIGTLRHTGCLVLAGDPKQLGPVIKCREAEKLGLGESLLERLFEFQAYERDEFDHNYDKNFITKLIMSYRCDPRILGLCNKLFYHDELSCLGQCPESLLKAMNFAHPLVFHPIEAVESQIQTSLSRRNKKEAELCVEYVIRLYEKGVSPDKIGIITPYLLQKETIASKLNGALQNRKTLARLQSVPSGDEAVMELAQMMKSLKFPVQEETPDSQLECEPLSSIRQSLIKDSPRSVGGKSSRKGKGKKGKEKKGGNARDDVQVLEKRNWMCQIDTVDAFQGKEKEIIIISTVRSPNESSRIDNCGFLADAKRFNVAISRAKWLVIVIGHPAILNCHKNWTKFGESALPVGNQAK